jgi:hypothetical protein
LTRIPPNITISPARSRSKGRADVARHVIGCQVTKETQVQLGPSKGR